MMNGIDVNADVAGLSVTICQMHSFARPRDVVLPVAAAAKGRVEKQLISSKGEEEKFKILMPRGIHSDDSLLVPAEEQDYNEGEHWPDGQDIGNCLTAVQLCSQGRRRCLQKEYCDIGDKQIRGGSRDSKQASEPGSIYDNEKWEQDSLFENEVEPNRANDDYLETKLSGQMENRKDEGASDGVSDILEIFKATSLDSTFTITSGSSRTTLLADENGPLFECSVDGISRNNCSVKNSPVELNLVSGLDSKSFGSNIQQVCENLMVDGEGFGDGPSINKRRKIMSMECLVGCEALAIENGLRCSEVLGRGESEGTVEKVQSKVRSRLTGIKNKYRFRSESASTRKSSEVNDAKFTNSLDNAAANTCKNEGALSFSKERFPKFVFNLKPEKKNDYDEDYICNGSFDGCYKALREVSPLSSLGKENVSFIGTEVGNGEECEGRGNDSVRVKVQPITQSDEKPGIENRDMVTKGKHPIEDSITDVNMPFHLKNNGTKLETEEFSKHSAIHETKSENTINCHNNMNYESFELDRCEVNIIPKRVPGLPIKHFNPENVDNGNMLLKQKEPLESDVPNEDETYDLNNNYEKCSEDSESYVELREVNELSKYIILNTNDGQKEALESVELVVDEVYELSANDETCNEDIETYAELRVENELCKFRNKNTNDNKLVSKVEKTLSHSFYPEKIEVTDDSQYNYEISNNKTKAIDPSIYSVIGAEQSHNTLNADKIDQYCNEGAATLQRNTYISSSRPRSSISAKPTTLKVTTRPGSNKVTNKELSCDKLVNESKSSLLKNLNNNKNRKARNDNTTKCINFSNIAKIGATHHENNRVEKNVCLYESLHDRTCDVGNLSDHLLPMNMINSEMQESRKSRVISPNVSSRGKFSFDKTPAKNTFSSHDFTLSSKIDEHVSFMCEEEKDSVVLTDTIKVNVSESKSFLPEITPKHNFMNDNSACKNKLCFQEVALKSEIVNGLSIDKRKRTFPESGNNDFGLGKLSDFQLPVQQSVTLCNGVATELSDDQKSSDKMIAPNLPPLFQSQVSHSGRQPVPSTSESRIPRLRWANYVSLVNRKALLPLVTVETLTPAVKPNPRLKLPPLTPNSNRGEGHRSVLRKERYDPYISAERQMLELLGTTAPDSPPSPPQILDSPTSAFAKVSPKHSSEEVLEYSLPPPTRFKDPDECTSPLLLNNSNRLSLSSLSLCSSVSIDSVENSRNLRHSHSISAKERQGSPRPMPPLRSISVVNPPQHHRHNVLKNKLKMEDLLYGGSNNQQENRILDNNERELLESVSQLKKLFIASKSTTPPPNDTPDLNESCDTKDNTKAYIDSAYNSLNRGGGGTEAPQFCHECGTKYPVITAKFCCQCGLRRIVI